MNDDPNPCLSGQGLTDDAELYRRMDAIDADASLAIYCGLPPFCTEDGMPDVTKPVAGATYSALERRHHRAVKAFTAQVERLNAEIHNRDLLLALARETLADKLNLDVQTNGVSAWLVQPVKP